MASYKDTYTYDSLPDVLRSHFAVPVSPHCEIRPGDEHLHTSPEWQNRHIWLLVLPFQSAGTVVKRWGWKDDTHTHRDDLSFKIEENAHAQLMATIHSRMMGWNHSCSAKKAYHKACREQYDIFREPQRWERYLAAIAGEFAEDNLGDAPGSDATPAREVNKAAGTKSEARTNPDASSGIPSTPTTLASSSAEPKLSGSPIQHSIVEATQENSGMPTVHEDEEGFEVVTYKKTSKQKKKRQRTRTLSGLKLLEWVGEHVSGTKSQTAKSHK
ncbi:hypothetical protein K466DRAFT_598985 [Polyporus arcularius HHB13444]|uniref:Uncharacterized protein n=1 Tax=Polyporus arcularius HHB13444 TaxID=1314778 RepID=A0A5C3PIL1_9APHY|nr:hypothetical protein K466DRAFT_598985 [Polyporus arcularius HHB13444]